MEVGQAVLIKPSDSVYPRKRAVVVKVDTRNDKPYLGLEVDQYGVDHVVWRFTDEVEVEK